MVAQVVLRDCMRLPSSCRRHTKTCCPPSLPSLVLSPLTSGKQDIHEQSHCRDHNISFISAVAFNIHIKKLWTIWLLLSFFKIYNKSKIKEAFLLPYNYIPILHYIFLFAKYEDSLPTVFICLMISCVISLQAAICAFSPIMRPNVALRIKLTHLREYTASTWEVVAFGLATSSVRWARSVEMLRSNQSAPNSCTSTT